MSRRNFQKQISLLLAVIILLSCCSFSSLSAGGSYFFYLVYSDIQANNLNYDQSYYGSNYVIYREQLERPGVAVQNLYLAKNEYEGFQIYFHEMGNSLGQGRQLSFRIEPFVNANGEILESTVYKELYMTATGEYIFEPRPDHTGNNTVDYSQSKLAEGLVPYDGTPFTTEVGKNLMLYVELKSTADQTPGAYDSVVYAYDGDELLATKRVRANVWHFALPEAHYATTIGGLYDSVSQYEVTSGFLHESGVRFDENDNVIPEDIPLAERILEGWDEVLLKHGMVPYEIPRFLIEQDEKAAELKLADPRRKAFVVPLVRKEGDMSTPSPAAEELILQYKNIVYDNPFLKDKAFFYFRDEQNWTSGEPDGFYKSIDARIKTLWPGFHSVVPMKDYNSGSIAAREAYNDILCMNQAILQNSAEGRAKFTNGSWFKTWRYSGDISAGSFYFYRWGKSTVGIYRRILYWQQEVLNSNGILNWNFGYIPQIDKENKQYFDVWQDYATPPAVYPGSSNSEGTMIFPSAKLGYDPAEPVVTLRMKQIASGMDDYDYLQLAKEFLGKDSEAYHTAINTLLARYQESGIEHIYSCELPDGGWNSWDVNFDENSVNRVRVSLGAAIDSYFAANEGLDHAYGDWEVAVAADETHDGLKIRTCADCGTQQSMPVALCGENEHVFDHAQPKNESVHNTVCSACGYKREQAHTLLAGQTVAPTCTEQGYEGATVCAFCRDVIDAQTVVPPLGHDFTGEFQLVEDPTALTEGRAALCCGRCRAFGEERVVPAIAQNCVVAAQTVSGIEPGVTARQFTQRYFVNDYDLVSVNPSRNALMGTGSEAVITHTDGSAEAYTVVLYGDVDGDGWYDGTDAYFVSLVANGLISSAALTDAQHMACDANHDGNIDNADAALLERAGLLLNEIDQTATPEELQTNSVYLEYCSLIDQTVEIVEPIVEEPAQIAEPRPAVQNVWVWFRAMFRSVLTWLSSIFQIQTA